MSKKAIPKETSRNLHYIPIEICHWILDRSFPQLELKLPQSSSNFKKIRICCILSKDFRIFIANRERAILLKYIVTSLSGNHRIPSFVNKFVETLESSPSNTENNLKILALFEKTNNLSAFHKSVHLACNNLDLQPFQLFGKHETGWMRIVYSGNENDNNTSGKEPDIEDLISMEEVQLALQRVQKASKKSKKQDVDVEVRLISGEHVTVNRNIDIFRLYRMNDMKQAWRKSTQQFLEEKFLSDLSTKRRAFIFRSFIEGGADLNSIPSDIYEMELPQLQEELLNQKLDATGTKEELLKKLEKSKKYKNSHFVKYKVPVHFRKMASRSTGKLLKKKKASSGSYSDEDSEDD